MSESFPSSLRAPTNRTPPGYSTADLESSTGPELPVVYPPRANSFTIGRMDTNLDPNAIGLYHRLSRTCFVPVRAMERIHSLIRAPFRLLTEKLQRWNRLRRSPNIRPLLAALMISILIPASCILHFSQANYVASFTVLVVTMHLLIYFLKFVTDDLVICYGERTACLLHATMMNAVEVIVAVVGLTRNGPQAVKTSLLGSLIFNMLLIPGLCFFFGGLHSSDQHFKRMILSPHSKYPMVILAFVAVILPSILDAMHIFNLSATLKPNAERRPGEATHKHSPHRIVSIIILLTNVGYTSCQLLLEPGEDVSSSIAASDSAANAANPAHASAIPSTPATNPPTSSESSVLEERHSGPKRISAVIGIITLLGGCGLLVITTILFDASLQHITEGSLMSKWFVGFILSPLVANMPDAIAAVAASINGEPYMDLIISETLSAQMTSVTIPLVTIAAWGMGKSFGFSLDWFEATVLALSVILPLFLHNEKGTQLAPKGMILMSTYLVVAATAWFNPGPQ
ncbi:hypothetical protein EI94DRAFT_1067074 [Lactarius quietus]|nr:hypothetical protein EI94DRAFT_1067074 [Lactarius quietus]